MTRNSDGKITTKGLLAAFSQLDPTAKFLAFVLMALPFTGGLSTIAQVVKSVKNEGAVSQVEWDNVQNELRDADSLLSGRLDTLAYDVFDIKNLQRREIINDYLTSGVLTDAEIADIQAKRQNQRLHLIDVEALGDVVTSRIIQQQNKR